MYVWERNVLVNLNTNTKSCNCYWLLSSSNSSSTVHNRAAGSRCSSFNYWDTGHGDNVREIKEFVCAKRCTGSRKISTLCVRVFVTCRSTKGRTNVSLGNPLGEEYHIRRTARLPAFVVVVSPVPDYYVDQLPNVIQSITLIDALLPLQCLLGLVLCSTGTKGTVRPFEWSESVPRLRIREQRLRCERHRT